MLDKEQPAPEANGDSEPVLEVPDGFPEGQFDTKAMDGRPVRLGSRIYRRDSIPADFDAETQDTEIQQEESPSPDKQPDSD